MTWLSKFAKRMVQDRVRQRTSDSTGHRVSKDTGNCFTQGVSRLMGYWGLLGALGCLWGHYWDLVLKRRFLGINSK